MCPLTQRKGVFLGGVFFKFRVLYPQSFPMELSLALSLVLHTNARERERNERETKTDFLRRREIERERSSSKKDATTTKQRCYYFRWIYKRELFKGALLL